MLFLFHVSEDRIHILKACFLRSCCHICWELGKRVEVDRMCVLALGWSAGQTPDSLPWNMRGQVGRGQGIALLGRCLWYTECLLFSKVLALPWGMVLLFHCDV